MHLKSSTIRGFLILCLLAGLTTLLLTSISFARESIRTIIGTVTKVSDGDTIQAITPEKTKLRVRLYGIDAPEMPKTNPPPGYVGVHGESTARKLWKPKS
jgi:micrococcal nuclease